MSEPQKAVPKDDEHSLVTQAKAGDYAAFEELVNRYEKKIYRLAFNITGHREDAEDVLQEAFMKSFQHLHNFREGSRFYTWLVRIAVNEGLMKLRKRRTGRLVQMEESTDDEGHTLPREFVDGGGRIPKSSTNVLSSRGFSRRLSIHCRPTFEPSFCCGTWRSSPPRRRRMCWKSRSEPSRRAFSAHGCS